MVRMKSKSRFRFHAKHQFLAEWHFQLLRMHSPFGGACSRQRLTWLAARRKPTRGLLLEMLILRPEIDRGSNILLHARGLPARPPLKTSPRAGFPGASGPGDVHTLGCRPASAENGTLYRFPGASAPADYSRGSSPDSPRWADCFVPLKKVNDGERMDEK
jgi:hypothetical protein